MGEQNWTMWYSARNKKLSWIQNQVNLCSISTVEEFWHSYNQMKLASHLPSGQTYAVFKAGIVPDWEDKANVRGGRWMIYYEKSERKSKLDERWMECLLLALGNHLDKCVTGVQVCVRGKQDRVGLARQDFKHERCGRGGEEAEEPARLWSGKDRVFNSFGGKRRIQRPVLDDLR